MHVSLVYQCGTLEKGFSTPMKQYPSKFTSFRTNVSNKQTCRYFQSVLLAVSSGPFYNSLCLTPVSYKTSFWLYLNEHQVPPLLPECTGGLGWNSYQLFCHCHWSTCFRWLQRGTNSELPCSLWVWFLFSVHYKWVWGISCRCNNVCACMTDGLCYTTGEVLSCWCWFCTLWHTLGSIPRCMLSSSRMGKGRS